MPGLPVVIDPTSIATTDVIGDATTIVAPVVTLTVTDPIVSLATTTLTTASGADSTNIGSNTTVSVSVSDGSISATANVSSTTTTTTTTNTSTTTVTKDLTVPVLTPLTVEAFHFFPWLNKPTVTGKKEFDAMLAEQAALNFKRGIQGGIQSAEAVNLFESVLSQHNSKQRLTINKLYKTMFGRSMAADINRELRGDLRDLSLALVAEPGYSDAVCLKEAMSGQFPIFTSPGTDECVLIEILTSRTNAEISAVVTAYKDMYDDDLDTAIKGDTSDRFELFLMSLLNAAREELGVESEPLSDVVTKDVLDLHTAASGEYIGMDFFYTFNRILCLRSFLHIKLVYEKYLTDYKVNLETLVKALFDHDEHVKDGFLAIIQLAVSQADFFEEILFKAIINQDEKAFIRVIRSRAEKDLAAILTKLKTKRAKSIDSIIASRRSASYRQLLTALTRDPSVSFFS